MIMNNKWIIAIKVQVSKSFEFYFWFYLWFYHSHKKRKDSLEIQKRLLSRWLHSKLISTLKFLGNWKIMFWVISQEQHNIKTHEFTETNSYFYSFTYEKNIFSGSFIWPVGRFFREFIGRQKSCGFNTKILSAWWRYKPGF